MKVTCEVCGKLFEAQRSTAKACSARCRKRKERRSRPAVRLVAAGTEDFRPPAEPAVPPVTAQPRQPAPLGVVEATRRELEAAGRLDTSLGQQALRLAERMHSEYDTGSALAAVSRQLCAVMAEALKDAKRAADPMDELAARRKRKATGA